MSVALVSSRFNVVDVWQALKDTEYKGWKTMVLDATFPVYSGPDGLMEALDEICMESSEALRGGQCQVCRGKKRSRVYTTVPWLLAVHAFVAMLSFLLRCLSVRFAAHLECYATIPWLLVVCNICDYSFVFWRCLLGCVYVFVLQLTCT